jgi:hypothetical protein
MVTTLEQLRATTIGQEADPNQCAFLTLVAGFVTYALMWQVHAPEVAGLLLLAVAADVLIVLLAVAFTSGTTRWFLSGVGVGLIAASGLMVWSTAW